MKKLDPHLKPSAWIASVVSGCVLALGYPGYGFPVFFVLGFLPLCWSLESRLPKQRFWHGWRAGTVFYLLILPWVLTLWDWASVVIVVGYVALCAGLGVVWGGWAVVAGRWGVGGGVLGGLGAAALWSVLEFFRSIGTFGFAWGNIGHTLIDTGPLVQLAAWTGEWGLSFIVVLSGLALFAAVRKRHVSLAWVSVTLIATIAAIGSWHQANLDQAIAQSPTLQVAMVQPNIPQQEKSDPSSLETLKAKYLKLLDTLGGADLVVLPESMLPTLLLEDPDALNPLLEHAQRMGAQLLLGSFTRNGTDLFNSTLYLAPDGSLLGQYDKVQLVPFSTEYFPLKSWVYALGGQWLSSLPLGTLTRGLGFDPLPVKHTLVGTPICFETTFSNIAREFVRRGATVLISITNDAWFKDSIELEQHWQMGKLRAVETGKAFVQVANTGVTGIALPTGITHLKLVPNQAKTAVGAVPVLNGQTIYVRWGDWFVWLCGIMVLLVEVRWRSAPRKLV